MDRRAQTAVRGEEKVELGERQHRVVEVRAQAVSRRTDLWACERSEIR